MEYDLPAVYALAMKAIEAKGANWVHAYDPNRPRDGSSMDCYNAFKVFADDKPETVPTFVPGCLIGTILVDAGVASAEFLYTHAEQTSLRATLDLIVQMEVSTATFTVAARGFMRDTQYSQDKKVSWGMAVSTIIAQVKNNVDTYHLNEAEEKWLSELTV